MAVQKPCFSTAAACALVLCAWFAIAESSVSANIFEVQHASLVSPWSGKVVSVSGIVTAVAHVGFYLQDPLGDGNRATSDALFVFTRSTPSVTVGDEAVVSGMVSEFTPGGARTRNQPTTQIAATTPASVSVRSSGNALPAPVLIGEGGRLPPTGRIDDGGETPQFNPNRDGLDFFESLESMRVTVRDPVTISSRNRFGELWVLADRGAGAILSPRGALPISELDFNPERIQIDPDNSIFNTKTPDLAIGTTLSNVTGILSYNFGNHEIIPTEPIVVAKPSSLKPAVISLSSTSHRALIATVNTLNIDPTDGGAKFAKLSSVIVGNLGSPDVIALQEVQDSNGKEKSGTVSASLTLQLIVDAIARNPSCVKTGCPTYAYVDNTFIGQDTSGGQPGGNIRTAYLFRSDRIAVLRHTMNTVVDAQDQQTNSSNPFFNSRLPFALQFIHLCTRTRFEIVNVHFSSKGGSAPLLGVEQPFETRQEEAAVNGNVDVRRRQAEAVRDYIAAKTAAERSRVIVTGDFNEFEFVSPVKVLEQDLTLLTRRIPAKDRYTFIFQGNAQVLDHFLVGSAFAKSARVEIVHVNVEFPTKQAASDHEPVVVQIDMK